MYARRIFPRLMDWVLSGERFQQERQRTLSQAYGEVLEIGFGTGLNVPHYPPKLSWLRAVDPINMLPRRVEERASRATFPIQIQFVSAEALPFEEARFDCAVSTFTLCSVRDPKTVLTEVRRVLKPGGLFLFLEHGRSDDAKIAKWQDLLTPVQRLIACGCHLNRKIDTLIAQAGLSLTQLDRFRISELPRIAAEMYRGVAIR
ncbi:class I SAM-dependent methyltransferase [Nitrospira calida]